MLTPKIPDARLLSAVPHLRPHAAVADIGTDHAYLPIYLVREGLADRALACDIRPGPLASAIGNIRKAGLEDKIQTLLTDGLSGVEPFAPNHILIFGMGGELIAKILSEAEWIKSPRVRLILQPMSRAEVLRAYLAKAGFAILGESLSRADGRIYQTISAEWRGTSAAMSPVDCMVGRSELQADFVLYKELIEQKIKTLKKIIRGKETAANEDPAADRALLDALSARLLKLGGAK